MFSISMSIKQFQFSITAIEFCYCLLLPCHYAIEFVIDFAYIAIDIVIDFKFVSLRC
jgi:hypothetical protein